MLLVCGRGLTGSDKTESAVPGRCKLRTELFIRIDRKDFSKVMVLYHCNNIFNPGVHYSIELTILTLDSA